MSSTAASSTSRTGLRREARLSRAALDANLAVLVSTVAAERLVVDVRADAYGHGLSAVVGAAAEVGIRRFRVSPGVTLAAGLEANPDASPEAGVEPGLESLSGLAAAEAEHAAYGFAATLAGAPLKPVLSLVGEVVAIKRVPENSGVSYGYTYRTDRPTTLALVGLGYADGVPRLGSNRAFAAIAGAPAPIAGRIAMDQFVLDLGGRDAAVGDDVLVWGDRPAARDWAVISGRPAESLTAGLGPRVIRIWIEGTA